MIDRYGQCPNCQQSWEGEDVFNHINSMSINTHRSESEVIKMAQEFGWKPDSRNKFSSVIVHEYENGDIILECPNIRCGHAFNAETGVEYRSIYMYKQGEIFERKPLIMGTAGELDTAQNLGKIFRQQTDPNEPLPDVSF